MIDLGHCLNLTDRYDAEFFKQGYDLLKARGKLAKVHLPKHKPSKTGNDILLRNLDCSVINSYMIITIRLNERGSPLLGVYLQKAVRHT